LGSKQGSHVVRELRKIGKKLKIHRGRTERVKH